MTIAEIENLSHAELKAQRDALIAAAQELPAAEVATRYVQARTDAKLRDEKLAEQGKTIDSLNVGNTVLSEKLGNTEALVQNLSQQLRDMAQRVEQLQAELGAASAEIAAEKARADKAEKLAKARRKALADVMQVISPVLIEE